MTFGSSRALSRVFFVGMSITCALKRRKRWQDSSSEASASDDCVIVESATTGAASSNDSANQVAWAAMTLPMAHNRYWTVDVQHVSGPIRAAMYRRGLRWQPTHEAPFVGLGSCIQAIQEVRIEFLIS